MNMTFQPGDFPLGSVESRAVVRAMIERERSEDYRPGCRVFVFHPPHDCQGESCIQTSETGPAACHLANERFGVVDGKTFFDVPMRF
jgi:hypothetical protein